MVKIKLKWNKNTYEDFELDPALGVDGLKATIYALTSVPKDRQKLMAKGSWTGVLKDGADLSSMEIKEGQQVMLMGTADVVAAPKEAIKFVEDMSAEEMAKKGAIAPAGLKNLGNTCYMNSTVECLRYMPELRQALSASQNINLASLLRATYEELDRSAQSIPPFQFVHNLRSNFPQFGEMNQGRHMQQDAEEFYNALTSVIQREIDRANISSSSGPLNFSSLLGIELEETLSCQECPEETPTIRFESVNKLVCNIQGGSGAVVTVDHMDEGLKLAFEGTVEKRSDLLNRDAVWNKRQRLSSLPRYLCVQFMRFFWKATPDSRDRTGVKCKILRAVNFPETLDVFEYCNDALQDKLRYHRNKKDKDFGDELAKKRAKLEEPTSTAATSTTATSTTTTAAATAAAQLGSADMELEGLEGLDEEEAAALREAMKLSMGEETTDAAPAATTAATAAAEKGPETVEATAAVTAAMPPAPIGNGLPDDFTGKYEIHAIVTHKGRSADSGHYMGWVRQSPGSAFWWCYDDDKVTEVTTEDIMKLKGGGDRDMAYLNFYRFKE